jgi:transposase-like protein
MVIQVVLCRHCQSQNVIRHGVDESGVQRYRCRACGRTFRQNPGSAAHPEALRRQVLAAYQERPSMRGITRVFGVSRQTLAAWLKKSQGPAPAPADTDRGRAG